MLNDHDDARRPRIGFVPRSPEANDYCARMTAVLEQLGTMVPVPSPTVRSLLAQLLSPRMFDVLFVSWLENRMLDRQGKLSWLRIGAVLLRTLRLRMHARKLVMIRHNHVPHATTPKHHWRVRSAIDLYEKWLFDGSLTHSPVEASRSRHYCPHPLYRLEPATRAELSQLPPLAERQYFVVFGRIEPYKQLEELMRRFPRQRRLIICGRCADKAYLTQLIRTAPENVHIMHEPLTDAQAQALIRSSSGLVISHASSDMIVSASFFYAMTLKQRVFAVATPFLEWASAELGEDAVVTSPNLEQLCLLLSAAVPTDPPAADAEAIIQRHFGDEAVARQLALCMESIGVPVTSAAPKTSVPFASTYEDAYGRRQSAERL